MKRKLSAKSTENTERIASLKILTKSKDSRRRHFLKSAPSKKIMFYTSGLREKVGFHTILKLINFTSENGSIFTCDEKNCSNPYRIIEVKGKKGKKTTKTKTTKKLKWGVGLQ